jgi:hypothetical protein
MDAMCIDPYNCDAVETIVNVHARLGNIVGAVRQLDHFFQTFYQQHLLPGLVGRGVRLVAVSPQAPDGSLSMRDKHDLSFTVVSDPGNGIARGLGILTRPSNEARAAQLQLGLDLTAVNADGTTGVPMPTVAILDGNHVLRRIDVHPDYSTSRRRAGTSLSRANAPAAASSARPTTIRIPTTGITITTFL